MDVKKKYEQGFDKVWEDIFFAKICNETTCLLCGYRPSLIKKYILYRHYNNKHLNEYSKYVGQEKYNLIEGLKLVHQEGCSSISQVDNTTSSKALIASLLCYIKSYCQTFEIVYGRSVHKGMPHRSSTIIRRFIDSTRNC